MFSFSVQAQNYYYNGSDKIEIYQSKKSFISYDKPAQTFTKGFKNVKTFATKGFSIVEEEKSDILARKFRNENLTQTIPALLLNSNSDFKLFPTKTIRIKLRAGHNKADISKLLKSNDFTEIEEKYGILRVTVKDIRKVLEIANKIYESDIAEFSIPDFYIPMELNQVNDPLFPLQFQMHNTGQVIDGVAGVNDIDVNALEAWNINLGDNVTVAVFDQGMENHEDFGNRLIGGNTPATNGNGTPLQNNATHGMNCAGVIGASDDNLGLRGVAPNVNFLSVNIFAGGTTPGDIADGIQWAIDNGADVLSNSWSYPLAPCNWTNIDIENALQNAVTTGRNNKGAVVVFSAGNTGGCVNYPARNNNVISVGAVDNRGILFEYSSRGSELDLVAPSGETNYLGNVRTTDRMGNSGRLPGHYEPRFGGTSASCPVVSGVAALVLSVNPNLTQQEVRDILISTATDMGVGGFDNNFGFGRVNAFAAVLEASPNITLTGNSTICNSNTLYSLSNVPNGVTVSWSVSSNLQIVTSSTTGATVVPVNSTTQDNGFIRATIGTRVITKDVWLGKPRAYTRNPDPVICTNVVTQNDQYILPISPGAVSYQLTSNSPLLYVGENPTPGQDVLMMTSVPGNYTITLTTSNECGNSQATIYVTAQNCGGGIFRYSTYPNPSSENIIIQKKTNDFGNFSVDEIEYKLFDFRANFISKGFINGDKTVLDVKHLKKGRYILKVYGTKQEEIHHIIIE